MGKKVKKKGPNPRKALQRVPAGSRLSADRKPESEDEAEITGEACSHYSRSAAELNQILSKIRTNSADLASCEHCRDEPVQGRGSKQHKKKGGSKVSETKQGSNFMWVCLDCNRYFCGGEVSTSEPYGHARRHSKQEKHPWAVRSDDPTISWCYACNSKVPIEMPAAEEARDDPKPVIDPDDGSEPLASGSARGYIVRGLSNLGNTCFFNSVMQNLLATDVLRDYLSSLERPFGPITMALKKIFAEMSSLADAKGVMSPKALFGSICAKQPQFRGYQQQDSHELLRYLLAGLDAEETNYRKLHNNSDEQETVDPKVCATFVDMIFGGEILSAVCCVECGFTSVVCEPFLDLSLPVPSKKPPSNKKPPPLPPKRSKAPLRERNKGRKYGEKANAKDPSSSLGSSGVKDSSASERGKEESLDLPDPEQGEAVSTKAEDDFTWLDFLDNSDSTSFLDATVEAEQIPQHESTTQCTSASQINERSEDLGVSLKSCGDLGPMSCIEDSSAHLLPSKESNPTIEGIDYTASCSQTPENADFVDAPVEEEFDGFGDMFNEPEVTSVPKKEDAAGEEMDLTLWTGNSSESNHDEVDDTNSPVSINSCLALFTKPELLTGEQAWHCERCSENVEPKTSKPKTAATLDEDKLRRKKSSQNLEVEEKKVLDNGMMTSTSNYLASKEERLDNTSTIENTSLEPLDIAASSANNQDEFDSTTQSKSCPSALENSIVEESSVDQDSVFCTTNDINVGGCHGESEPTSSSACETDTKNEGKQLEKKCSQLLKKGHTVAGKRGEKVKSETSQVKRDATKRILIYRTPPILTIHLKRFSQDARGRLSKLSGHVGFSETLDLRPYMDPRCDKKHGCQYRLIGVVEHSGSMSGGHYIAYVRGERGRGRAQKSSSSSSPSWFYASDAHVRESSLSEVLSTDAYILFYERVPV